MFGFCDFVGLMFLVGFGFWMGFVACAMLVVLICVLGGFVVFFLVLLFWGLVGFGMLRVVGGCVYFWFVLVLGCLDVWIACCGLWLVCYCCMCLF